MRKQHRSLGLALLLVAAHAAIVVAGPALHALPGLRHTATSSECHSPTRPASLDHDSDCAVCGLARLAAAPVALTCLPAAEPVEHLAARPPFRLAPAAVPRTHLGRAPPRGLLA
jgi:hypothetical protein